MPKKVPRAGANQMNRTIRLQPHYVSGKWDKLPRQYPKLTIAGKWFQDAGFHPYTLIQVQVEKGRLVITSKE
jgi:hypothetical protein